MPNRAVFIGGLLGDRQYGENVSIALEPHFDVVEDPVSLREALGDPEKLRKVVKGAAALTHSGGLAVLEGAEPASIDAINPPFPINIPMFLAVSGLKFARMHVPFAGFRTLNDLRQFADLDVRGISEIYHYARNPNILRRLGAISRYDSVDRSIERLSDNPDMHIGLGFAEHDEYFRVPADQKERAKKAGIKIVEMAGTHIDLALRPAETVDEYMDGLNGVTRTVSIQTDHVHSVMDIEFSRA